MSTADNEDGKERKEEKKVTDGKVRESKGWEGKNRRRKREGKRRKRNVGEGANNKYRP